MPGSLKNSTFALVINSHSFPSTHVRTGVQVATPLVHKTGFVSLFGLYSAKGPGKMVRYIAGSLLVLFHRFYTEDFVI